MRNYPDWIAAYLEYTAGTEAPEAFHVWTAVSTIAGALRRKVWIDMHYFQWVCNFYIVFVAKPGIVTKSTAIDMGMGLLEEAATLDGGIRFGPESSTWQALLESLEQAEEITSYTDRGGRIQKFHSSSLTIKASELGTFLKADSNGDMNNVLIDLWDGKRGQKHATKTNGETSIRNPLLNIIGATTPSWMASNFKANDIQGGFASRVVFVHADQKAKFIAFPDEYMPSEQFYTTKKKLVQDLNQISKLSGEFIVTNEVREWGRPWYYKRWTEQSDEKLASSRFDGYKARKWTLIFKLAMVFSASRGHDMKITMHDIERSLQLLDRAESFMLKVYESVDTTAEARNINELTAFVAKVPFMTGDDLYKKVANIMTQKDFREAITAAFTRGLFTFRYNHDGSRYIALSEPFSHRPDFQGTKSVSLD